MKHLIQQSALKSEKLKMILASLPLLFPNFSKIGGGFWRIGFGFFFPSLSTCTSASAEVKYCKHSPD